MMRDVADGTAAIADRVVMRIDVGIEPRRPIARRSTEAILARIGESPMETAM